MSSGGGGRGLNRLFPDGLHIERLGINLTHLHITCSTSTNNASAVDEFELQWTADTRLQPVIDKNPRGRIRFLRLLVRHRSPIHASGNQRKSFPRFEQISICRNNLRVLGSNLSQRGHLVQDPESTAIG